MEDQFSGSEDDLMEQLHEANTGVAPSPSGVIEVVVLGRPASVQASKSAREVYINRIKESLTQYQFVLTGQVFLDVVWYIPAKSRFETDATADIDNCLKPIIDAFTGPTGLIVNDCQLKGLYICWRHIDSGEERLEFEFKFEPDQYSNKSQLVFIRMEKGLCSPANLNWPQEVRSMWARILTEREQLKHKLEALDAPYLSVSGLLGGSQPFHVTRTGGFSVISLDEFVANL